MCAHLPVDIINRNVGIKIARCSSLLRQKQPGLGDLPRHFGMPTLHYLWSHLHDPPFPSASIDACDIVRHGATELVVTIRSWLPRSWHWLDEDPM